MTDLLSKNSFNDLREKQQLAYRVDVFNISSGAKNKVLFCNILTTTNDSQTGETSYKNVQSAINGFHKLIDDIKNGNFTEEELDAVKLRFKARILDIANSEPNKISILQDSLSSPYGILCSNTKYNLIDTITKEEILNAANYIFSNNPTYGICANKETLEYNSEFLNNLKNKGWDFKIHHPLFFTT